DLDRSQWLCQIALADQEPHLFSGPVFDNIACARLDSNHDEVQRAAACAELDDFISELPQGYETKIGNGGTPISGGQKQRIILARAFLRTPEILILDEAMNALDSVTE